jgi:hypothetical protein
MASEMWVAVNIDVRLEVVDERALVQAALAVLKGAEMSDEERQMRISEFLDAESGAEAAACWLLGERVLGSVPGFKIGTCTIAATYADSEYGLDHPYGFGVNEPE